MTQGEPQTSGDPGTGLPGAAARRSWQPSSLRAAQSISAAARGLGPSMVDGFLAWHERLSRRGEGLTAPLRPATFGGRIEAVRAPVREPSSLRHPDTPLVRTAAIPSADTHAVRQIEPTVRPTPQAFAALPNEAPAAPRLRVSAGRQDPVRVQRFAAPPSPLAASASATAAPPPRPSALSSAPVRRQPHEAAAAGFTPHEPAPVPPERTRSAAPAFESAAIPSGGPEIEASPRPPIERHGEPARVSDEHWGEDRRTAVVVIERQAPAIRASAPPAAAERSAAGASVPLHGSEPSVVRPGAAPQGRAIEKLIERTIRPVPVPGLEIRLLKPAPRAEDDERTADEPGEPSASASPRPAPAPAPPPPLDIEAVADKVYRLLQRRQRFERERKGRY